MRPRAARLLELARHDRAAPVGVGVAFVLLFLLTSALAAWHHERQRRFAREWSEQGEALLRAGRASAAVEAFENALVYGHNDPHRQYRLAAALVAAGRDARARTYLLALWQRRPGEGRVNVELARLEARAGRLDEAIRYYQQAVHGSWDHGDPIAVRHRVRLEMAEKLAEQGSNARAEAEIIILAAEGPLGADESVHLGELHLRVGAPERALALFRSALAADGRHPAALAGAGRAAFAAGDYASARPYLERALRARPDARNARLLAAARQVLAADPSRPRLSTAERGRRAAQAWQAALDRLSSCSPAREPAASAGAESLQLRLEELRPRSGAASLARDPDLREELMDRVFDVETWSARECGEPQGMDLALTLLARRRAKAL
jgi:tetratricopeptide (TPR) repeat protein